MGVPFLISTASPANTRRHPPGNGGSFQAGAYLDRWTCQLVRQGVAGVELHVLIDVHPSGLPRGELLACDRQGLQRSALELLEQVAA
jgi:hypothetical protein